MVLFFGENFHEFLEIGDTSARKYVEQPFSAATTMHHFDKEFSLWPSDARDIGTSQFGDKRKVRVNKFHQFNAVGSQPAQPRFVQRTCVATLRTDICSSQWDIVLDSNRQSYAGHIVGNKSHAFSVFPAPRYQHNITLPTYNRTLV